MKLEDICGNELLKKILKPFFDGEQPLPGAILIFGPSGSGKTTLANIIANHFTIPRYVYFVNVADLRGIDNAREIIRRAQTPIFEDRKRIWILDEINEIGTAAMNSFLNIFENTPKDVHFILTGIEGDKLPITIRRRCLRLRTEALEYKTFCKCIAKGLHSLQFPVSAVFFQKLYEKSYGCIGIAKKLLSGMVHFDNEGDALDYLERITSSHEELSFSKIAEILFNVGDLQELIDYLNKYKKEIEANAEALRKYLLSTFVNQLLVLSPDNIRLIYNCIEPLNHSIYDSSSMILAILKTYFELEKIKNKFGR